MTHYLAYFVAAYALGAAMNLICRRRWPAAAMAAGVAGLIAYCLIWT